MAPSGKRIKARRRSTRKPIVRRRTHYKKLSKIQETTSLETAATTSSSITYSKTIKRKSSFLKGRSQTPENKSVLHAETNSSSCNQITQENVSAVSPDGKGACSNGAEVISSGCSTPKGHRFRIPEIVSCPRAPLKRRVVQNCTSVRRGPIAFFAPPDIELFFLFALGHVPAA